MSTVHALFWFVTSLLYNIIQGNFIYMGRSWGCSSASEKTTKMDIYAWVSKAISGSDDGLSLERDQCWLSVIWDRKQKSVKFEAKYEGFD